MIFFFITMLKSFLNFHLSRNRLDLLRFCSNHKNKKICIVGSGPAGFYTAQHILKKSDALLDIFEKLPVPFGLIRYGVAPDHPEIKVVTDAFTQVAQNERCRFFGNVNVGCDVRISELLDAYHAVVLAFGASKDKNLGIPGEDLQNVLSAREFVNWYNGHPDYAELEVDLNAEIATIIGQGNVALDVARILLKTTDELKNTDIVDHALTSLEKSKIKKVILIGRRGPLQVAFTIKELRELIKLEDISIKMNLQDFDGIPQILETLPRPRKRITELLYNTAKNGSEGSKTLEIKFFRSPKCILSNNSGKATKLVLGINAVDGTTESGKVVYSGKDEEIETGLVLKSVGYQSRSIDPQLPFDDKNFIVPNKKGQVIGQEGLYCSGWVKTGPSGVLLSTMSGSFETGETLLEDMKEGKKCFTKDAWESSQIMNLLKDRGIKFTSFEDWLKIDKIETERGLIKKKPREKIYNIQEMLQITSTQ